MSNKKYPIKPLDLLSIQERDELSNPNIIDVENEVSGDDLLPILDVSSARSNRTKKIRADQLISEIAGDTFADKELSNIDDYQEARDNLGLGDLAIEDQVSSAIKDNDAANVNARLGEFSTVGDVEGSNIPSVLESIRVAGRASPGDGAPLNLMRGSEAPGATQSADGQWWEDVGYSTITVRIPSQFPTLQAAVDHYSRLPMRQGAIIEILIENGHQPASGVAVKDGDFGKFVIRSEDAVVTLDAAIGRGGSHFISGDNAVMPVLDCLIDANEQLTQGYYATNGSRGRVTDDNGIYNAWGTGLYVRSSFVVARNTVWTDCAINGNTGSGIICWSGHLDAEGADVSRSGYYGAQSAYGAVTNLTYAIADDCVRYGFRCRNASTLNVESGRANNCGVNAIRAFNNGYVAARYFEGKDAGDAGLTAQGASIVQAQDSDFSGAENNGIVGLGGSTIDARNANAQRGAGPSTADFFVAAGSTIYTGSGVVGGLSQPANAVTGQGIIYDNSQPTPFPDGNYEQWTPEITCGSPGDLAVTYSTQIGRLVKMGSLIVATFTLETSSFTHSTATGALRIAGLPDNSVATSNVSWYGALSYGGLVPASGVSDLTLELNNNSTDINIRTGGSGSSRGFLGVNHTPSGNSIVFRGTVIYWGQ